MTDVNTVAEPSAANDFNVSDQNTWSPEQREHWNKTGNIPEPPKKEADSASADAPKEAKSEGKPKSAAEPEAAPKQESKGKQTAEERIAELISDRKRLEERLRKLESQPATKPEAVKEKAEPPKRPNPYTFKGTPEEFEKAMDDYEAAKEESQERRFVEKQLANARNQQFTAKVNEARQRYGAEAFDGTVEPTSKAIMEQAAPTVKEYLQQSDLFADLLYVIGGNQKSLDDFLASAKSNPVAAIRKLAFLEIEIGNELSKGKAKSEEKDEPKPEKKAEAPAKPEPRAPKPPSEVGGRGTAPTDELEEAARSGDFRKFEAEENRRMQARYAKA